MKSLSFRSLMAFLARAIRRVQPLYASWDAQCVAAIETSIANAEAFARGESYEYVHSGLQYAILRASHLSAVHVAKAANYLSQAVNAAHIAEEPHQHSAVVRLIHNAMLEAFEADPDPAAAYAASDDYTYLCVTNETEMMRLGECIDAGENGPLGPLWPPVNESSVVELPVFQEHVVEDFAASAK